MATIAHAPPASTAMTDQPHHPAKINPDTRELARSLTKNGLADASLDTSEAHQTSHSILQPVATPPLEAVHCLIGFQLMMKPLQSFQRVPK
ncbi:hypothetical protein H257_01953 [Aphanomyces astaci]|uniref:Uncharacterized protein n=1 Tax=Aphanomyces astaci TaxID=112090 RepID=W4H6J7_APHAT|nr:hypothetical protein H257_01953 [Aphanomyces astaci]ETV86924.1 hypothetical protein H257_01953 [Aphanomyces astaci]|eukprot:XP_009823723.1 hypothetical protein H257_01953 [Aphanomyces astaci]